MKYCLLYLCVSSGLASAQIELKSDAVRGPAYSYKSYKVTEAFKVYTPDKKKVDLTFKGLTFVQIWSVANGGEPILWNRVLRIQDKYRNRGLVTISLSIENGANFENHHKRLNEYLATTTSLDRVLFDSMGYAIDFMQVPGFPSYILLEDDKVVFTTLGEDAEGVDLLEKEIEARLH